MLDGMLDGIAIMFVILFIAVVLYILLELGFSTIDYIDSRTEYYKALAESLKEKRP